MNVSHQEGLHRKTDVQEAVRRNSLGSSERLRPVIEIGILIMKVRVDAAAEKGTSLLS